MVRGWEGGRGELLWGSSLDYDMVYCGLKCWWGANWRLGHMSPFFHAVLGITLEVSEREVTEASGSVQVAIRKMGTNERSVFVRVFTVSGTAEGTNYIHIPSKWSPLHPLYIHLCCIHRGGSEREGTQGPYYGHLL